MDKTGIAAILDDLEAALDNLSGSLLAGIVEHLPGDPPTPEDYPEFARAGAALAQAQSCWGALARWAGIMDDDGSDPRENHKRKPEGVDRDA